MLVARPPNITANKSQSVALNCYADANPPVTTYNWTKNGQLLAETGPIYRIPSAEVGTFLIQIIDSAAGLKTSEEYL